MDNYYFGRTGNNYGSYGSGSRRRRRRGPGPLLPLLLVLLLILLIAGVAFGVKKLRGAKPDKPESSVTETAEGAGGENPEETVPEVTKTALEEIMADMDLAVEKLWVQYAHMFGIMSRMAGRKVGVMPRFVETRPVRADFAKYPSCLCVKQAIYMWFLAKHLDLPRFRRRAIWNACNLPVEYASRIWHLLKRRR